MNKNMDPLKPVGVGGGVLVHPSSLQAWLERIIWQKCNHTWNKSYMNICPILYTGMVVYIGQWRPHFPTKYGSAPMWYISGNVRSTASIWCMCLKKKHTIENHYQLITLYFNPRDLLTKSPVTFLAKAINFKLKTNDMEDFTHVWFSDGPRSVAQIPCSLRSVYRVGLISSVI